MRDAASLPRVAPARPAVTQPERNIVRERLRQSESTSPPIVSRLRARPSITEHPAVLYRQLLSSGGANGPERPVRIDRSRNATSYTGDTTQRGTRASYAIMNRPAWNLDSR